MFEAKVVYNIENEKGNLVKKSTVLLVDAYSFTEVEAYVTEYAKDSFPRDWSIASIKIERRSEYLYSKEPSDPFFDVKISMVSFNEKTKKEAKSVVTWLVQAEDIPTVQNRVEEELCDTVYEDTAILSISKTPIELVLNKDRKEA